MPFGPWLSASIRADSGSRQIPIGTLIQKIQCQDSVCTTAPPTSGPSATAIPLTPDHTPIAMPRRSSGNASASSVRVSGVTSAAPAPCTARAATSIPVLGATDAPVNTVIPSRNMRLRPKRSPSAAPVSSNTA